MSEIKYLVIAEKKNLAVDISKAIGGSVQNHGTYLDAGEYRLTWCSGHVLELLMPDDYKEFKKQLWSFEALPIFPSKMVKRPTKAGERNINIIKDNLKRVECVIHAGDPDRAGQIIIDEVLDYLHYTGPVKRLLVNNSNTPAIVRAMKDMRDNNEDRYKNNSDAGVARQYADWKFGMNLSPAFSLAMGETIGIGRVQTVVLAIIADRDTIIDKFGKIIYYMPVARVLHREGSYRASWVPVADTPTMDGNKRISDKAVAQDIAFKSSGVGAVSSYSETKRSEGQPLGYTMSKMQIDAGRRFGFESKRVMEICQSLYDIKKVATYPRASCPHLPDDHIDLAPGTLKAIKSAFPDLAEYCDEADLSIRSPIWNQKKVDEESHHAIVPTDSTAKGTLTEDEKKIYRLLCERYLMQWMPAVQYLEVKATCRHGDYKYAATGRRSIDEGWRRLFGAAKCISIPEMAEGDPVEMKVTCEQKETKPPPRFTDAGVVDAMVNVHKLVTDKEKAKILRRVKGIGTEATRDTFVDKLCGHGLLERTTEKKKKVIKATAKGLHTVAHLRAAGAGDCIDPATTAMWEYALDRIARGEITMGQFNQEQEKFLLSMISKAKGSMPDSPQCPVCSKDMNLRPGKNGKFWSCAGYPECKGTINIDENGNPVAKVIPNGPPCPKCSSPMAKRKGRYGEYFSCSGYPKCNNIMKVGPNGEPVPKEEVRYAPIPCPKCKSKMAIRKGSNGEFYGCTGYPKCSYLQDIDAPHCPSCGSAMLKGRSGWWCKTCKKK